MQFYNEQYSASRLSQLDLAWHVLYLVMTAVGKRVLVTKREQLLFNCAIAATVAVLVVKLCSPRTYAQWRPAIVVFIHMKLTTLRALAVISMAPAQATFWRPMRNTVSGHRQDSLLFYFCTMLGVTGGSHRLLELLGLQQPYVYHVVITLYYVLLQFVAGLQGYRMGYANALFYVSHEGYDAMSAVLDTVVDSIIPLPSRHQATCNSCPGITVYATVLLYTGAAMPLYVVYVLEQAAYKRFKMQVATRNALQNAEQWEQQQGEDEPWQQNTIGMQQQQQQQQLRRRWHNSSRHGTNLSLQQQQQQRHMQRPQQLHSQQQNAFPNSLGLPLEVQEALEHSISQGCLLSSSLKHLVILLGLLLLCWCCALIGSAVAVRHLSAESLEWWCPNKPRPPICNCWPGV